MTKEQLSAQETYNDFFSLLKRRIKSVLKPPTAGSKLPPNIVADYPKLILKTSGLMDTVGAQVTNENSRVIVVRELLKWIALERPDILYDMISDKELIYQQ